MATDDRPSLVPSELADPGVSTQAAQQWRLGAKSRKLLLVVHLVAGVGFLGSSLAVLVLTMAGANGAAAGAVYPAAQMLTTWLVIPLAIAALIVGLLQATLSPWGVTRYGWVVIKLVITVVLTVIVLVTLYPRIADAAGAAIGQSAHPLTSGQRDRIAVSWPIVCALLIVNMFMGIYKPSWRLRARRDRADIGGKSSPARVDGL